MPDIPPPFPGADPCPQCASKGIVSYLRIRYDPQPERFGCVRYPACQFQMFFEYYGHEMLVEETEQLLQSGQTDVIEGFQSKDGERTFSARLILGKNTGWRVRPLFDYQFEDCITLQEYQRKL